MVLLPSSVKVCALIVSAILLYPTVYQRSSYCSSERAMHRSAARAVSMIVWTDPQKVTLGDALRVNGALQNTGDETTYVDRRMFWTGYGGGVELEIKNEQGKILPSRLFSDVLMPPPPEGDASILIRLEPGFLYGSYVYLKVKDFFPKPGRYSLRVTYKSWLRKETVPLQLRDLPALWSDSPEITSEPVWIEVNSTPNKVPPNHK